MNYFSAIQKINYPTHRGVPNPCHGRFMIVGSIPFECYDFERNCGAGGSKLYDTEDEAAQALIDAGAPNIQRADCSVVRRDGVDV